MAIYRLLQGAAFDPEAVKALTDAYEATLQKLKLTDRTDPLTEIVATAIITAARSGERDPIRLMESALADVRQAAGARPTLKRLAD